MHINLPWLLRAWRTGVAKITAIEATKCLSKNSRSTLSQWETGKRDPGTEDLQMLDACYKANGLLIALAEVIGTPAGLPARTIWYHNFDAGHGAAWVWLRSQPGASRIAASVSWGPLVVDVDRPCDDRGIVVVSAGSMQNPPLRVEFDQPAWADFGNGTVPASLGIPVVKAVLHFRLTNLRWHAGNVYAAREHPYLKGGGRWLMMLPIFLRRRARVAEEARAAFEEHQAATDLTVMPPANVSRRAAFSGGNYRQLRSARRLSQEGAAKLASDVGTGLPEVTADQVRWLEKGGMPSGELQRVQSRLDLVYNADGQTFTERVEVVARNGTNTILFPDYWVGPVWIAFVGPSTSDVSNVLLRWKPVQKRLRVSSDTTVTTRRSAVGSDPLLVFVPETWRIVAGIGQPLEAHDINADWAPADDSDARTIADAMYGLYKYVSKNARRDVAVLVGRIMKVGR